MPAAPPTAAAPKPNPLPPRRRRLLHSVARRISPLARERVILRDLLGYWPHIRRPRSFNEHLAHRRFFEDTAPFAPLADKYAVRTYIRDSVGEEHINPLLAVGDRFDDIAWHTLPERFVVKATHGSTWNYFVERKSPEEIDAVRSASARWLSSRWGVDTHERWYADIPPRLIVEPFLGDPQLRITSDFKCYTFHGRVHFIQFSRNRLESLRLSIYDRDWNIQPWGHHYPPAPHESGPPPDLERMITIAQRLARPFTFVRVDLYNPAPGRIIVGELTFAPGAGRQHFTPDGKADFLLGSLW